jgi:hypothetical protein
MRAILRLDTGQGFSFADARRVKPRDHRDTVLTILADLVSQSFLVHEKADLWRCTDKGRDLQQISRQRLSRAKAEQLLAEVIERACEINGDDHYAMRVNAIVVFGSFLTAKPMIGDIDLAVQLRPRFENRQEQDTAERNARERGRPRNIVEAVAWPDIEVRRALRTRSRVLELHEIGMLEAVLRLTPGTPFKVVLGEWAPPRKADGGTR